MYWPRLFAQHWAHTHTHTVVVATVNYELWLFIYVFNAYCTSQSNTWAQWTTRAKLSRETTATLLFGFIFDFASVLNMSNITCTLCNREYYIVMLNYPSFHIYVPLHRFTCHFGHFECVFVMCVCVCELFIHSYLECFCFIAINVDTYERCSRY